MKEIKLSQRNKKSKNRHLVALVDDEDFEYLSQWNWCACKSKDTYYSHRVDTTGEKRVKIRMHRLIMRVSDPETEVDHKDNNGLNNQKSNLRVATGSQNSRNRSVYKRPKSSRYKGVNLHKAGKWVASIGLPGSRSQYLGWFVKEEDAAKAYDEAAKQYFGEFAKLNFKEE